MNVLCDFHHTDLFRSLRSLVEKRLGWRLFRPLGLEWREKGYVFHPDRYFGEGVLSKKPFNEKHLRDLPVGAPSHYPHGTDAFEWSWITLEEASQTIDLILSTHPENHSAFFKFRQERRPGAKLVRYIGNEGEMPSAEYPNLLLATLPVYEAVQKKTHAVFFHPEFDTSLYSWQAPPVWDKPVMRTFLNFIYHQTDEARHDHVLYCRHLERLSPNVHFYTHGQGTPPPNVRLEPGEPLWSSIRERYGADFQMPDLLRNSGEPKDHAEISQLMKNTNLAWHAKTDDGYGYLIHQLYASGRPIVCRRSNYQGKTAGILLKDKKTCVMVDGSVEEDIKKISHYLRPHENRRLCENARDIFKKTVNFDHEFKRLKKFFENLRQRI